MLVQTGEAAILLDCGYSVPPYVWRAEPDANAIDALYLSHAHADHYFGVPGLLGRMWEEGRTKPLVIMSQKQLLDSLPDLLEYGYRGLRSRFQYELQFCPVSPESPLEMFGAVFRFAPTKHSATNLAIRVEAEDRVFCYSGDGDLTDESRALFRGADLLVHEAFGFDRIPVHATVQDVLAGAESAGVAHTAFVHIQRKLRRERVRIIDTLLSAPVRSSIPEPGEMYEL